MYSNNLEDDLHLSIKTENDGSISYPSEGSAGLLEHYVIKNEEVYILSEVPENALDGTTPLEPAYFEEKVSCSTITGEANIKNEENDPSEQDDSSNATARIPVGLASTKSTAENVPCYLCSSTLEDKDSLLHHLTAAHPAYQYHCVDCRFSAEHDVDRVLHLALHQRRPYKCDFCPLRYVVKEQRERHEFRQHNVGKRSYRIKIHRPKEKIY